MGRGTGKRGGGRVVGGRVLRFKCRCEVYDKRYKIEE